MKWQCPPEQHAGRIPGDWEDISFTELITIWGLPFRSRDETAVHINQAYKIIALLLNNENYQLFKTKNPAYSVYFEQICTKC